MPSSAPLSSSVPASGPIPVSAGIGLRFRHHRRVAGERPAVGWLEIHSENYLGGGETRRQIETIRADYPLSCHGVGLSLGSADGLDPAHLVRLRRALDRLEPALVSEHLSWSRIGDHYLADLLPLPLTEEALDLFCRQVDRAQTALGRRILIENPSTYLRYRHSTIPEWEFLAEVVRRSGCGILCDVNNIFVSACNHGFDAARYLDHLPAEAVGEIHLAGHSLCEIEPGRRIRIDDHSCPVSAEVWALFERALALFGPRPSLIEWDTNVPELEILLAEATKAETHLARAREEDHAADAA